MKYFKKDHSEQFAIEMKKHVVPNMTPTHAQSVIRHLVSANVLLKEQLDKQSDEKSSLRKKLLQMERDQSHRDRALAAKQKECDELKERLARSRIHDNDHENEENRPSSMVNFKSSPSFNKSLTSTPKSTII